MPPDIDDEEPRHPWWALSVLAMLTVLVVTVTVFLVDSAPQQHDPIDLAGPTQVVTPTAAPAPTTRRSAPRVVRTSPRPHISAKRSPTPRMAAPVAPTATPVHRPTPPPPVAGPCGGAQSCVLPGGGGVEAALNAARSSQGASPLTVTVTAAAQQCAVQLGCAGQSALQTEHGQDGAAAVRDLLVDPGSAWLLAPGTTAVAVGWAYSTTYGFVVVLLRAG